MKTLLRRGHLSPWSTPYLRDIYVVTAPYADLLPLEEEQILQEANPEGYFCFQTALLRHGLSNQFTKELMMAAVTSHARPPLGTQEEDWLGLARPVPQTPETIGETAVTWAPTRTVSDVGVAAMTTTGGLLYVTDAERSLLDAIQHPELCLGISNVLRAWKSASRKWDLDRLLAHVAEFRAGPVMKQRVGFLVETAGGRHPTLEEWRKDLQRGGSLKLVAANPYSAAFSERWNLSLNVPPSVLGELEGE